jgi:phytoene dehydrogenase-like protein
MCAMVCVRDAAGITDIDAALLHEVVYTPDTWQQRYNCHRGAAFGLNHHFGQVPDARAADASLLTEIYLCRTCSYPGISGQVGYLRPQSRHAHHPNLYFCGSSTHPGSGLPNVLVSSRVRRPFGNFD